MPKAEATIEISPIGFDELTKKYSNSREVVLGTINRMLRRMGQSLVPSVKNETPLGASHKLRNTTVFQVLGHGEEMSMEIRQSAFSPGGFPYGVAVRTGTRPHFPPYLALVPWVQKVLGVTDEKQAPRVAFLVARKISQVGTVSNPYHLRAMESTMPEIRSIIAEETSALAEKLGDGV